MVAVKVQTKRMVKGRTRRWTYLQRRAGGLVLARWCLGLIVLCSCTLGS